jgi:two-component system sensor histidine kinase/response regulator
VVDDNAMSRRLSDALAGSAAETNEAVSGMSAPEASTSEMVEPHRVRPVVLLAEDNQINQIVARGMLEKLGYRVLVADTGRRAVEAAGFMDYAAILMNIHLPDMDGFEATAAIRATAPMRHLPIIGMTANVLKDDRERCLAAGMDEYVSKPVRFDDLARALAACVQPSLVTLELRHVALGSGERSQPPSANVTVVDTASLEGLRALRRPGQSDPVPRLVDLFIRETESRLARLRLAVEHKDLVTVHGLAHAQKGSSGTIGARQMQAIAREMEHEAAAGAPARVDQLMHELESAFQRSREVLERLKLNDAA